MSAVEQTPETLDEGTSLLPILPLRETVVFPTSVTPLAIGQERSIRLIDEAVDANKTIALVTSRSSEEEAESAEDLYEVGTSAVVHKMVRVPDGTLRVLVQGLERVKLEQIEQKEPYLAGRFTKLPDVPGREMEVEALAHTVESLFGRIISMAPYLPEELLLAAANAESPSGLANLIGSTLRLSTEQKQELLEAVDVEERLRKLTAMLSRELEVVELGTKIQSQVHEEMDKSQREYFLRQQLKAIQDELGEGDEQQAEIAELRTRLEEANLPEEPAAAARRELDRLAKLPRRGRVRRHPDVPGVADLRALDGGDRGRPRPRDRAGHPRRGPLRPGQGQGADPRAPRRAEAHQQAFRPDPVLRRPTRRRQDVPRPVDRAGTGTQVRPHLGGRRPRRVRDPRPPPHLRRGDAGHDHPRPARRGHEEPGLHDRRDRQDGRRLARRPSSAMLEVLDPAQNSSFRDHYLDLPFDLSQVLFICTANQLEPIPGPLRDRMEIIPLAGYTEDEKVGIARTYLVPKQLEAHGLDPKQVTISENALHHIVREYTREAGVRNLDRELAAICRKVAREIAEGKRKTPGWTSGAFAPGSARPASAPRCAGARRTRGSRLGLRSRRWAATSSSWRPPPCPARAGSRSRARSAT